MDDGRAPDEGRLVTVGDLRDRLSRFPDDTPVFEEADHDTPTEAFVIANEMLDLRGIGDDPEFERFINERPDGDDDASTDDDAEEASDDEELLGDDVEDHDQDEDEEQPGRGNDPRPRDERDVPWSDIRS